MYRFISNKFILQQISFFVIVAIVIYQMIKEVHFVMPQSGILHPWQSMASIEHSQVWLGIVIGLGLLFQLVSIFIYVSKSGIGDSSNLMPAWWFLLTAAAGGYTHEMSPIWLTNICFSLVILLNLDSDSNSTKGKDWLSGVITALATLFYYPAFLMVLFVIISLTINRFNKTKDIALFFIGMITLYLYFFCYYFFTDQLSLLFNFLSEISFVSIFSNPLTLDWHDITLLCVTIVSVLYAIVCLKSHFDNRLIIFRKRLINIHVAFFINILLIVFSPFNFHEALYFLIYPITLYFSMLSQQKDRRALNSILMTGFIIALCL